MFCRVKLFYGLLILFKLIVHLFFVVKMTDPTNVVAVPAVVAKPPTAPVMGGNLRNSVGRTLSDGSKR